MLFRTRNRNTKRVCTIGGVEAYEPGFVNLVLRKLPTGGKTAVCCWNEQLCDADSDGVDDGFFPDYDFVGLEVLKPLLDGDVKFVRVGLVVLEKRHDQKIVVFAGRGYVMNDEGKTIERL